MLSERWGNHSSGIHRADLHNGLDRLDPSRIERPHSGVARGWQVLLTDESVAEADVIVGADGMNSVVREADPRRRRPQSTRVRRVSRRGAVGLGSPGGEWWASGSSAGLLSFPDGRVYWYVPIGASSTSRPPESRARTSIAGAEVVAATPPAEVLMHPL